MLLLPEEPVLTLQQLRREYLLLRCTLAVAENLPGTWRAAWGQSCSLHGALGCNAGICARCSC